MAELAIGISKTAVEALVNKVKSAIKEEAEKWQTVERDIVFIKDEFEMMQSFLNTASGERMKDQIPRTWVRQVRDLSYDTEDCIDFVLHLDTKRSLWYRLRTMVQKTLPPLDQAVTEINRLKSRAEDVSKRNKRYSLIGSSEEQLLRMSAISQTTLDIFIKPRDGAFDNQSDILDLAGLIKKNDKGLQVVAVCGTRGDLGITSIIKKVYEDQEICQMFQCRAWVKLMHPFDPHEFIRSLLVGFYANASSAESSHDSWLRKIAKRLLRTQEMQEADVGMKVLATMEATNETIIADFMEIIKIKQYLIVLEDLLSIVEWNAIRTFLPDTKNSSRIVVSTQQLEIATLCMEQPNHVLLQEFSTDHSVYAFFKELQPKQQGSERKTPCVTTEQIRRLQDPGTDHWQDHHHLFGRASEIKKLGNHIAAAYVRKVSKVVSVYGIAGVGKSFLVGAFYDHFAGKFDGHAFVSASHPFDIMNFCQNLVHLEEKQCLVVIDDIRTKDDWDLIEGKLILRASRSCIIVITREESVARHCTTSDNAVCRVEGLEAHAARKLFEEETKSHGANWDKDVMEEAESIMRKCGRLPKLSVALVKYLADVRNNIREARRLNVNFMYALKTSEGLGSFRDVFTWMYSNFQACPPLLKKCVFYLSIFTQSSMIRHSRLVRRWIAEGYSDDTDSNSIVENTQNLIHKLVTLGMMQDPRQIRTEPSCQINSFFLDYVISRGTEENIFRPLEVCLLKSECRLNTQNGGQHLTIGSSWKRDNFVFDSMDFSRLRSLTVSREWKPFLISDRMRVLRVLDLEDTNVADDDIEQVVRKLPRLKFLGLRRCIKVSCLPDSLGDLRQLQTLDIRHTSVTKLPKSIRKLQKLQYIRAATRIALMEERPSTQLGSGHGQVDACDGIMVPGGIGALLALHTLGVVSVSSRSGKAFLNELKNLTQLKKLGVSGINRSNIKGLLSAIEGHSHLESLSLQLHKEKDLEWLGKMALPRNLLRLKMYVHVVKYPHWSCLQVLGKIKRLHTLGLRFEMDHDVELQFCDSLDTRSASSSQFPEVKVLEIACTSNLHVKFVGWEMHDLEMLNVHCLDGSSLQLSGIGHLYSLKHVCLKGSFDDTVKEELRRNVAQHPKKPFFKLLVNNLTCQTVSH